MVFLGFHYKQCSVVLMIRAIPLGLCLFVAGLLCLNPPSRAQLTMTGVGGGFGGAAATVCSGTKITLTAPNDLTNAAWAAQESTAVANAAVAPDSTMTASSLTATNNLSFASLAFQVTNSFKTGGVTYSITGYLKSLVAPTWALVFSQEQGGFTGWGGWYNLATGAVGTTANTTCFITTSVGSGWYKFSIGGGFGSTPSADVQFQIYFADMDNSGTATIGQSLAAWQLGT